MNTTSPKNNRRKGICYICGKENASTRDHIPPKCIFPESLKTLNIQKITVWACESCNNKMGKIDEVVKDYLSLCIFTRHREELWEKTERKLIKSPRLCQQILQQTVDISKTHIPRKYIKNNADKAIKLPKEFDVFIERIFKGFHTHFTDQIIDDKYLVKIWDYPKDNLKEYFKYINQRYIVKDVLILLGSVSIDKKISIWWLQLYNNPMYICTIAPKSIF